MQHTSFGETTRGRNTILNCRDRSSRPPDIIDDECRPAAHLVVRWKLDELRPGDQLGLFAGRLSGEIDGGGQDVSDIHGFAEHPTRDETATRNDHHGGEFAAKLWD